LVEFYRWQSKVIEKKCKEDFMCDFKLQSDGYKSVCRILLMKTEP
jgi:hypothetical protein